MYRRNPIECRRDTFLSFSKQAKGRENLEQLLCEHFLQGFEFSRAFLPPVQHGEKREKFQNPVKYLHKAVVLIFLSLQRSSKVSCLVLINGQFRKTAPQVFVVKSKTINEDKILHGDFKESFQTILEIENRLNLSNKSYQKVSFPII